MGSSDSRISTPASRPQDNNQAGMAGAELPEELLQTIFDYCAVDSEDDNEDEDDAEKLRALANLCQVNSIFCSLARPLLYRTIKITNPRSSQEFARTVVTESRLANIVRNFSVKAVQLEATSEVPLPNLDKRSFKDVLRPLGHYRGLGIDERVILKGILRGSIDAHLTAALCACANIRNLSIQPHHRWKESHVGRILLVASILTPQTRAPGHEVPYYPLPQLRHLHIEHWDTEGATALCDDHIRQLLGKQSLESFSGHMLELQEEEQVEVWASRRCNLKSAQFTSSLMDHVGMDALLSCCPKLEYFHFGWGSATVGDCHVQLQEIGKVLRQHGKSLKRLCLDPTASHQFDADDFELRHSLLGHLRSLNALEELSLPGVALLGEDDTESSGFPHIEKPASIADLLPQSLSKLELLGFDRQNDDELIEHLNMLVKDKRLTGLKLISLVLGHEAKEKLLTSLEQAFDESKLGWSINVDSPSERIYLKR